MIDKLYKTFVDATQNVFSLMLNLSEISDHPLDSFECEDVLEVAIGFVGDLDGEVIYRFPISTSLNMVEIMSGMQFEQVDAFVTSAISEISNIISGNVLNALSSSDLQCNILTPVLLKPYENSEDKEYDLKTHTCINTSIGELCIEIRLNRIG